MEYEEILEWKKYAKDKDYEKAAKAINHEIAVNLLKVHNLYSDDKVDINEQEYIAYSSMYYGRNSEKKIIKEMEDFWNISIKLSNSDIGISRCDTEEEFKIEYKNSLNIRKKIIKLFKEYKKSFLERMM